MVENHQIFLTFAAWLKIFKNYLQKLKILTSTEGLFSTVKYFQKFLTVMVGNQRIFESFLELLNIFERLVQPYKS